MSLLPDIDVGPMWSEGVVTFPKVFDFVIILWPYLPYNRDDRLWLEFEVKMRPFKETGNQLKTVSLMACIERRRDPNVVRLLRPYHFFLRETTG